MDMTKSLNSTTRVASSAAAEGSKQPAGDRKVHSSHLNVTDSSKSFVLPTSSASKQQVLTFCHKLDLCCPKNRSLIFL